MKFVRARESGKHAHHIIGSVLICVDRGMFTHTNCQEKLLDFRSKM